MTGTNLRSKETWARSAMDWTPFNSCFPRGIKIGDADGIVEINWWLLLLEHKLANAARGVDRAHRIQYQRMAMRGDTAIVFWSDPPHDFIELAYVYSGREGAAQKPWTLEGIPLSHLLFVCREWAERAEEADRPSLLWPPKGVP
jgi:hypothetical protein